MFKQSYIPRGWIIFLQIFGTVFAVCGLIAYLYFMTDVIDAIGPNEPASKVEAGLILAALVYLTWKTIYTAVVIIQFIRQASDEEILGNRFILSALSLNLGGIWTPMQLTALPNVGSRSTINPRWFLSRAMGVTALVGGPLAMIAFFSSLLTGTEALTTTQLFDTSSTAGTLGVLVLAFSIAITVFGIVTVTLFYQKSSQHIFESEDSGLATMMNVVAIVWLAIITIELLITMFFAIMRLLGALVDLFQAFSSDGIGKSLFIFSALLNLMLTMVYVGFVLYLTSKAMVGIWAKDGFEYQPYESLARAQERRSHQTKIG